MSDPLLLPKMQTIAKARAAGLGIRLGLGAVAFGIGLLLVDPVIPAIWAIAMVISQVADHRVYRRLRDDKDTRPVTRRELAGYAASTSMATVINMSLPIVVYFAPLPGAKVFALIWICGALLNVMVQQSTVKPLFFAGAVPLLSALLGLPLFSMIESSLAPGDVATFVICVVYGLQMSLGYRVYHRINTELVAARDEAERRGRAAEQANKAKSRFLALMSHELRTPMNGVLGAGHLLRETELSPRQTELVDALEEAGEILMVVLNDILDLAKLDAARMTLTPEPTNINELVSGLGNLWRTRADAKALAFSVVCHIDEGAEWAEIDKIRVRQIVGNLLSNAIKFTDRGLVELVVHGERLDDRVRLWFDVRDTGAGIAPETMAKLFRPFSQGDDSATRKTGGTGLGLMICRSLAELMGGTVDVDSAPGEGSTFSFRFEAKLAEAQVERDAVKAAREGAPLNILVAEDNAINRMVIAGMLEPGGHNVTFAEDGREAVRAAGAQHFDLIFMDVHMPEMDGMEATALIRGGCGPNADGFICALSADAGADHIEEALGHGMDAYLTKPISPPELSAIIVRARNFSASPAALHWAVAE